MNDFSTQPKPLVELEPESKVESEEEPQVESDPEPNFDSEPETGAESEPEFKVESERELRVESERVLRVELKPETGVESDSETGDESERKLRVEPERELRVESEPEPKVESEPEHKIEVEPENHVEEYSLLPCNHCDIEIVQKLEQVLLHGLATACVEKTASDLFRGPSAVAPEISKEMVGFLMQKTELLLSEFSVEADENLEQIKKASTHPVEYILELIENFIGSKRGLLVRVSGWISSETREAKIEDTAKQISETNSFQSIAKVLLRNMDIKGKFHCPEKFSGESEFSLHREKCDFRPVCCKNEGCGVVFSAIRVINHDFTCPFKVLPCDQECGERVVRYEMEKHCNKICTMRLVNCPFYNVGCESAFPYISLEKHCGECVQQHLFCVFRSVQKQAHVSDELKQRVQLLEKSQALDEMSGALDLRTLTLLLKEQEAKSKKLESLLKEQETKIKKLEKELSKAAKG